MAEHAPLLSVNQRVRLYRRMRGMKQQELAQKANTTNVTISRIENNEQNPSYEMIFDLAKALEIPPHELLREPGMTDSDAIEYMLTLARELPEPLVKRLNDLLGEMKSLIR